MHYFTCVGSRKATDEQAEILAGFALRLLRAGYKGRSGLSGPCDLALNTALAQCPQAPCEFYLAWNGYDGWWRGGLDGRIYEPRWFENYPQAIEIVSTIHPVWDKLKRGDKLLHGRNVYQVLGLDLQSPSDVLICAAPVDKKGRVLGGTATAFNLATQHQIPCFNIMLAGQRRALETWLQSKQI